MRRMVLGLILVALIRAVVIAGDSQPVAPSPPQAVEAQKKHDEAIKKAREAYHNAVIAADQQYIATLDTALKQAMTNQDIDLARALDDQKKVAESMLHTHLAEAVVGTSTPRDFAWERVECPAPVTSPAMVTYDGRLYLVGGVLSDNNTCADTIWVFDPDTGKWDQKNGTMPYAIYSGNGSGPIVVGTRMVWSPGFGPTINGGWGQHNRILTYDFSTDKATEGAEYPGQGRVWAVALACATVDGESPVYCFGGWNGGGMNSIARYDVTADRLMPCASVLTAGPAVIACAADRAGHIVVFGSNAGRYFQRAHGIARIFRRYLA